MRSPLRVAPAAMAGVLTLLVTSCQHPHEPQMTTLTVYGQFEWDDGTPIPNLPLEAGWIENTCLEDCASWTDAKFEVTWHGLASTRTDDTGAYELVWHQECHPGSRVEKTFIRLNADESHVYLRSRSCTGDYASTGLMCTEIPQEHSCTVTRLEVREEPVPSRG